MSKEKQETPALCLNMEALTRTEIITLGNAYLCPTCGKNRYVMWKAVIPLPYVPMMGYCQCPQKARV